MATYKSKYTEDEIQELKATYKNLAKRADQRLVRLERAAERKEYKNIKDWAYKSAQNDIKLLFGQNATRFNKKIDNAQKLATAISRVRDFLEKDTSTIGKTQTISIGDIFIPEHKGVKSVYEKRAESLNKWIKKESKGDLDLNISSADLIKLTRKANFKKAEGKYGWSDVMYAISKRLKSERDLKADVKEIQDDKKNNADTQKLYNSILRDINKNGLSKKDL